MSAVYRTPRPAGKFVHTNIQTVEQRASILAKYFPGINSIAEICCGDCYQQFQMYRERLGIQVFLGLDIDPVVVAFNTRQKVPCVWGDALDAAALAEFLTYDVIFFGPPLSIDCTGHNPVAYRQVVPSYKDFMSLLLGTLAYRGIVICICPKTTSMGDIENLYADVRSLNSNYGLSIIHRSHSTQTSAGDITDVRLKYIELWFSCTLGDRWEVIESRPA